METDPLFPYLHEINQVIKSDISLNTISQVLQRSPEKLLEALMPGRSQCRALLRTFGIESLVKALPPNHSDEDIADQVVFLLSIIIAGMEQGRTDWSCEFEDDEGETIGRWTGTLRGAAVMEYLRRKELIEVVFPRRLTDSNDGMAVRRVK